MAGLDAAYAGTATRTAPQHREAQEKAVLQTETVAGGGRGGYFGRLT
jgi:hypothetical protein